MRNQRTINQRGFTILELMIATMVLSVILLLCTVAMINIGNLFYKGITESRIQDGVRGAIDQVAQDIEFEAAVPILPVSTQTLTGYPGYSVNTFCVGLERYTYVTGLNIGSAGYNPANPADSQVQHILWRDRLSSTADSTNCKPVDLTNTNPEASSQTAVPGTGGTELVPSGSRLTNFTVTAATNYYVISLGMAYGDPSLTSGTPPLCNGSAGDQFCATDSLTSTVGQRL